MCGFVGLFDIRRKSDALRGQVLKMSKQIRHRGPDWSGVYCSERAILSHERLSIVDPQSGGQPLFSCDGKQVLAVNGEIYNHQEIRAELAEAGLYRQKLPGRRKKTPSEPMKFKTTGGFTVLVGKNNDGLCVSFESFAYHKLGYQDHYELGPGEIVKMTADGLTQLAAPGTKMKICAFLWTYYGYPNSNYEGKNVEVMRYRNGEIMARKEMEAGTMPDVDFVAGVPDSGLPHAIGYANQSHKPFARPFVKYTPTWPRSFTPANQEMRNLVAKMKQIPVPELIQGKKLLFVDDSIVRGTQLRETVDFLYESGAKEVHMRSACPPIMYGCKYLNFSRSNSEMELIARRTVQNLEGDEGQKHLDEYADGTTQRGKCMLKAICEEMGFDSLGYQSLDGLLEAIGLDKDKVCTYCWNGKE